MTLKHKATINMDDKHRVSLTRVLTEEERELFSSFRIYREDGKIILEPVCQVPEKDHWIYKNPDALRSLLKGIKDAEAGRLHDLGSFAEYAQEDDEVSPPKKKTKPLRKHATRPKKSL